MKKQRLVLALLILTTILCFSPYVWAASSVKIDVKTILASQENDFIDSKLTGLTRDLQSVFKYSSYRLLGQNRISLNGSKSEKVSLPGDRNMEIILKGISGNRATLDLAISSGNRQVFQTVIQLLNRKSVTVGGPQHQGGYLLFNISISFFLNSSLISVSPANGYASICIGILRLHYLFKGLHSCIPSTF